MWRKDKLFPQPSFAGWVGKESGCVVGWPALAAVHRVGKKRDGGMAGTCHGSMVLTTTLLLPPARRSGLSVLHASVQHAEAAHLCSGK